MKKSQLQSIIREEVRAALREDSNPELDNLVSSFVKGLAKRNGYQQYDAVLAIFEAMKRLGFINKDIDSYIVSRLSESKPLKEFTKNNFQAIVPGSGRAKIDPTMFAKLMPKSARTSKEAEARIKLYNGSTMFEHVQYFDVTPNGNMPNKPIYRLHQSQYYNNDYNAPANLKGESVNVTFLTVFDITNGEVELGVCYVDTKVFLAEYKVVFQLLKSQS